MTTESLFLEPFAIKIAAGDIPIGEPTNWDHEVTKQVLDLIPFAANYPTVLKFHEKDEKSGYGYGSLIINNSLIVPIIISKKMGKSVLSPLDVFNYNGKWFPLTEQRIEGLLFNTSPTERIAKPEEEAVGNSALGSRSRPPSDGREVIASLGLLDAVLPTARRKDLERVIDAIEKEARLLIHYKENDTFASVRKIASAAKESKSRDYDKIIREALPVNVVEINKTASGYKVQAISDCLYRPETFTVSALKVRKIFGTDVLKTASDDGYAIIENNRSSSNVYIIEDACDDLKDMTTDGQCTVKIACNEDLTGHMIINVLDFNLNKTARKIFTTGDQFAYQETIVGKDFMDKKANFNSHDLNGNVYGSFVYESKDGKHIMALEPIKISPVLTKVAEGYMLDAETTFGEKLAVVYTPHIETVMQKDGKYYIPSNMKFVKLGAYIDLESDVEKLDKVAKLTDADENKLDVRWSGLQYIITGIDDCETLDTTHGLIKGAALGALVKLGSTLREARIILDRAKKYDLVKAAGFKKLNIPDMNTNDTDDNRYINELVDKIKIDTVKIAAFIQDEETVDSVLSLNFVNPENLKLFMDYIPAFEDSVSNLASMLVASRLGMKEVDEDSTKQAMEVLDGVLNSLKETFNTEKTLKNIKE